MKKDIKLPKGWKKHNKVEPLSYGVWGSSEEYLCPHGKCYDYTGDGVNIHQSKVVCKHIMDKQKSTWPKATIKECCDGHAVFGEDNHSVECKSPTKKIAQAIKLLTENGYVVIQKLVDLL